MRGRSVCAVVLIAGAGSAELGCWPEPPALGPRPRVWLEPEGPVASDEPVRMLWSPDSLRLVDPPAARAPSGAVITAFEPADRGVWLFGVPAWPAGERVSLDLSDSLVGPDGVGYREPVGFEVRPWSQTATVPVVIRRPVPGRPAPVNLAWLSLSGGSGDRLRLEASTGAWFEAAADAGGAGIFRVDRRSAECSGLCAGSVYRVVGAAPDGPRGEVRTGTVADERAPQLTAVEVRVVPGAIEVDLRADETVRGEGRWWSSEAEGRLVARSEPGRVIRLGAEPAPPSGERVGLEVWGEDLGGSRTSTRVEVLVPEPVRLRITEVVPTPRRDWGDSEPNGEPFDPWPGQGTVSSADEWVELVNEGVSTVDAARLGVELRALDGSPSVTVLASAPLLRFGDGGRVDRWAPGEAVVVRTRGDMAQRGLRLELWAGEILLDALVLSSEVGADHPGGSPPDLIHEALARGWDGRIRWCEPSPGDPRPPTACLDR